MTIYAVGRTVFHEPFLSAYGSLINVIYVMTSVLKWKKKCGGFICICNINYTFALIFSSIYSKKV